MAAAKKQTKQDLEKKIAELEAKLTKLSTQLEAKPAEVKPAETKPAETKPAEAKPAPTTKPKGVLPKGMEAKPAEAPKPQEAPKPAEKPAPTTKPKGVLPKGMEAKPAEAPKPQEAPKPAETTSQPPATVQEALENAYYTAPMTSFHDYRAKVTGYSPAPNRYFVRLHAPVGSVPTRNWNDQKATVTGYTAPSNQYFATRQRMAFHPADKRFGSFSGVDMSVEGVEVKAQTQAPPPEAPKPAKGTLPKGF
ncbi:trans-sialidase [Nitrosopumilus adriaticus]|uniref:trans-sialidase n=1 Tax=Nitrosopumilus adriaticus TaxID=1580092 RepID=UPI00064F4657|nr:trans-sialidase [Nitrosopumilus adriaticus]